MIDIMDSNAHPPLPVLDGRHQFTLHRLTCHDDSFSIAYSITPPLPEGPDGENQVLLFIAAQDDLGNEYTDWGGVFGLAPDGSRTEGEVSGQPGLPTDAGTLHLRITFLRGGQEHPYELTLPMP